jgi:hypothetical protein
MRKTVSALIVSMCMACGGAELNPLEDAPEDGDLVEATQEVRASCAYGEYAFASCSGKSGSFGCRRRSNGSNVWASVFRCLSRCVVSGASATCE